MNKISRSGFLKTSLLAGIAFGTKSKLFASGDHIVDNNKIIITDVKTYLFKKASYIKIETSSGISGWGEGDHDHPEIIVNIVTKVLRTMLLGQNPFNSEYLWNQMFFIGEDLGSTGALPGAIAGIDNALWDFRGKFSGLPVHQLLGGNNVSKIRVYGSYGRSGGKTGLRTPDEMAEVAAGFVEKGYKTVKARMQIRQLNLNPEPDFTFQTIKAVRKAIGDEIELFVDYNNGYTPANAITLTKMLYENFNVAAIEEPVSYHDYSGLRQVVDAIDIPVMAGEHAFNKWQMRDLITLSDVDILNVDVIKGGGISECRKVCNLAEAFNKLVMAHNVRPTLASAATLQLIASIPNAARVQEYGGSREELGLSHLFDNYLEFKDGYIYLTGENGLGLIVNEKAMEKNKLN